MSRRFPSRIIPTLDQTYTSTLAGYSIGYPRDWAVTPAAKAWTSGYNSEAYSDRLIGSGQTIFGSSMKLPAGTSFNTWFAAYDADRTKTTCGAASNNEDITIDGLIGRLDIHCPTKYLEAVIPTDGRVYVFTVFQPFTRPFFESFLATVHLTPAAATP